MIARVLIAEHTDPAAIAQERDDSAETGASIKELHPRATALRADIFVDSAVAELLINRGGAMAREHRRQQLREGLPVAEMTEDDDAGAAGFCFALRSLEVVDFNTTRDGIERHRRHLDARKKIRAEAPETAAHEAALLRRGQLAREGDGHVVPREPAVVREREPGDRTKEIAQPKEQPQRERRDGRGARADQDVNAKIEHAGSALRPPADTRAQRKIACAALQSI